MLEKPGEEKKKVFHIQLYLPVVEHTGPCQRQGYGCEENVGSCKDNDQHYGRVPSEPFASEEDIESDEVQDSSNTGCDDGSSSTNKKTDLAEHNENMIKESSSTKCILALLCTKYCLCLSVEDQYRL